MSEQPKDASGGIRQIEPEEMVTIKKSEYLGMVANINRLSQQLELLGGITRLALPMLGGPMIYTLEVLEEQIDTLSVDIHRAKNILTPRDAFDFGLQLKIDMDKAFIAVVTPRPEQEILKRKLARDAAKATENVQQATPKELPPKNRVKLLHEY